MTKLELASIGQLFASPLFSFNVPDHENFNTDLLKCIEDLRSDIEGKTRSGRKGWVSRKDIFDRTEAPFATLRSIVWLAVQTATKRVAPHFDSNKMEIRGNAWININGQGAYNVPHNHGLHTWSGVYYVSVPDDIAEDSGFLCFQSPLVTTGGSQILTAQCFSDSFRVKPTAGKLVVFPSYLVHWVSPNLEDADRVSIAFNFSFLDRAHRDALSTLR